MNLFEYATRQRLRIATNKGLISVEDLWSLPLTSATGKLNLDDIARELDKKINTTGRSFVNPDENNAAKEDRVAFDVVLHIIATQKAENEAERQATARRAQKQKLIDAIAKAEEAQLGSKSVDELKAMLAAL